VPRSKGMTVELKGDETLVYTFTGTRAHISVSNYLHRSTICGFVPMWGYEFLGAGSQAEYERAASLPVCKRCLARRA